MCSFNDAKQTTTVYSLTRQVTSIANLQIGTQRINEPRHIGKMVVLRGNNGRIGTHANQFE